MFALFDIARWALITLLLVTGLGAAVILGRWLPLADYPLTRDAVGQQLLWDGHPELAAHVFEDNAWRAVAMYRDKRYQRAFRIFVKDASLAGRYNAASALAWLRHYDQAIAMLEAVLQAVPNHDDARHNLQVIRAAAALAAQSDPNDTQSGSDSLDVSQSTNSNDGSSAPNSDVQTVSQSPGETSPQESNESAGAGGGNIGAGDFDNPQFAQGVSQGEPLDEEFDLGLEVPDEGRAAADDPGAGGVIGYFREDELQLADEILLRRIVDKPEVVLRARLNMAAKKR